MKKVRALSFGMNYTTTWHGRIWFGRSEWLSSVLNTYTDCLFSGAQERLPKKVSDLAKDVAKMVVPPSRKHFDIVVACEDEDDDENDLDVPLVSIKFR